MAPCTSRIPEALLLRREVVSPASHGTNLSFVTHIVYCGLCAVFSRSALVRAMAEMPVWKGLLEWSLQHHDGTGTATAMSDENRKWLESAMKDAVVDFGKLLTDLKESIERGVPVVRGGVVSRGDEEGASNVSTTIEEMEQALDNLIEIVEHIDFARDLSSIGGLPMLLELLRCEVPGLQSRAAEVVGTCAQNNPPVQQSFYEGGVLEAILPLLGDVDASVRTKGLFALSCQLRGHPQSLVWLRINGGRESLLRMLSDEELRVQRKALQVLTAWVSMFPRDRAGLVQLGGLGSLRPLLDSEDVPTREAAFRLAVALASDDGALRAMQADAGWRDAVQAASVRLDTVQREDWDATRDEAEGVLALAQALARMPTAGTQPAEVASDTLPERRLQLVISSLPAGGAGAATDR